MSRYTLKRARIWLGAALVLIAVAIGAAVVFGPRKHTRGVEELAAKPARERNLAVFDAATALLKSHYYDSRYFSTPEWRELETRWRDTAATVEPTLLYMNALDNLARQFPESHVAFTPPPPPNKKSPAPTASTAANANFSLMYERAISGPGFDAPVIRRRLGRPQVVGDLLRGSPAERAGVMPGWLQVGNNISVSAQSARYSAEFLRLDAETSRELEKTGQVRLPGFDSKDEAAERRYAEAFIGEHTVKLEFELEKLPARTEFEVRNLPDGITYLRFDRFESLALVGQVLDAMDSAHPGGLILDLRHNPGGRGFHLLRIAGALLGNDVVLGNSRIAGSETQMKSLRFTDHYQGPLIVLIGPETASAAEIVAAGLQDHQRGKLIGRATNGSVIPGQWFTLPDGGKIMIPMSDFVRTDGRRIEGVGVQPDFWVLPTLDDVRAGRDPVLERAIAELRG